MRDRLVQIHDPQLTRTIAHSQSIHLLCTIARFISLAQVDSQQFSLPEQLKAAPADSGCGGQVRL